MTTCQICARAIKAQTGRIAHHGYTRPGWGYQTGSCFGAKHDPYEAGHDCLDRTVVYLRQSIDRQEARLARVRAEEEPAQFTHTHRVKDAWGKRETVTLNITRASFPEVREANSRLFIAWGLRSFDQVRDKFIQGLETILKQTRDFLRDTEERRRAWVRTLEWDGHIWRTVV